MSTVATTAAAEIFTIAGVAFQAMSNSHIMSDRKSATERLSYFIAGIGFEAIDVSPKEPFLISGIAFESASWKIGVIYLIAVLLLLGFMNILLSPQPTEKRSQKKSFSRTNSRTSLDQSPSSPSFRAHRYPTPSRSLPREDPFLIIGSPR
jgi:hypothetical protein